jgi:hypothetical protein
MCAGVPELDQVRFLRAFELGLLAAKSAVGLFWRDLEINHPGIDSLRLPADVATGWKERITTKITRSADRDGRISEVPTPRINALDHLLAVRSFYLDITQWATEDPVPVGPLGRALPDP